MAAGLGQNYVSQMRNEGKNVGADAVVKLCDALNISVIYVFTGSPMSREDEEFIRLFSALPDTQKDSFLSLLRSFQSTDATA